MLGDWALFKSPGETFGLVVPKLAFLVSSWILSKNQEDFLSTFPPIWRKDNFVLSVANWGNHLASVHPGQMRITSICLLNLLKYQIKKGGWGNNQVTRSIGSPEHWLPLPSGLGARSCTWEPDNSRWMQRHLGWARLAVFGQLCETLCWLAWSPTSLDSICWGSQPLCSPLR